jgi:hypothetical protein
MAAAKLTAPEVAVEHFAFGSKEEFYIEHLKFKKDAEDKMIFPKKEIKSPPRPRKLLGKLRVVLNPLPAPYPLLHCSSLV